VTGGRIVVVGDVIDDIVVRPHAAVRADTDTTSDIAVRSGGSGANTAAWLGALGADVTFIGTTHRDDVVRHRAALAAVGVTAELGASDSPTGAIVLLADGSTRTMFTSRGANVETTPDAVTAALLDGAAHLHISGYSIFSSDADWATLIRRARAGGSTVSVDLASAGYLADFGARRFLDQVRDADLLFANRDEAVVATGVVDPERAATALTAPTVVVKLGAAGALARRGQELARTEAPPVDAIDATGAGDAFDAGFLTAWIAGDPLASALRVAVETAARAVVAVGGRPI
jgi:sugar/nucleoside kinase (ribokinase family)